MSNWLGPVVAGVLTLALIAVTCAVFAVAYVAAAKVKQWAARRMGVDYDPD